MTSSRLPDYKNDDLHRARSYLAFIALALATLSHGCGIGLVDTVQDVFTDDAQADLRIRLMQGEALTCVAGPSVVVTVENGGEEDAPESITTVVFVPGGSVDVRTAELAQAESIELAPVAIPEDCFVPDCQFAVLADASFLVDEIDEENNRADGTCPATEAGTPQAP